MLRKLILCSLGVIVVGLSIIGMVSWLANMPPRGRSWTLISSKDWQFSAMFPSEVVMETERSQLSDKNLYTWWSQYGRSRFTVVVCSVPEQRDISDDAIYEWAAEMTVDQLGGRIDRNERIVRNGRTGCSQRLITEFAVLESNVFIIGDRMYQAQVAYPEDSLDPAYVDYFFDSFRISWQQ